MSNSKRCAACKYLRRRCPQDCVLAPYFPSNNPHRFACVHKIFGASNVTRMLQQVPVHKRAEAADCMSMEARCRVENPVYGCVAEIDQLQQEIRKVESELAKTRAEIAVYSNQQAQQQAQMNVQQISVGFQLDQQVVLPDFYFQQFNDQM